MWKKSSPKKRLTWWLQLLQSWSRKFCGDKKVAFLIYIVAFSVQRFIKRTTADVQMLYLTSNGRTCQHWNLFFVFCFCFFLYKNRQTAPSPPHPPPLILFILVRSRVFEIPVLVQSFLNSQYSHYRVSSTFTIKINIISWKWKKIKEVPSGLPDETTFLRNESQYFKGNCAFIDIYEKYCVFTVVELF